MRHSHFLVIASTAPTNGNLEIDADIVAGRYEVSPKCPPTYMALAVESIAVITLG